MPKEMNTICYNYYIRVHHNLYNSSNIADLYLYCNISFLHSSDYFSVTVSDCFCFSFYIPRSRVLFFNYLNEFQVINWSLFHLCIFMFHVFVHIHIMFLKTIRKKFPVVSKVC